MFFNFPGKLLREASHVVCQEAARKFQLPVLFVYIYLFKFFLENTVTSSIFQQQAQRSVKNLFVFFTNF